LDSYHEALRRLRRRPSLPGRDHQDGPRIAVYAFLPGEAQQFDGSRSETKEPGELERSQEVIAGMGEDLGNLLIGGRPQRLGRIVLGLYIVADGIEWDQRALTMR